MANIREVRPQAREVKFVVEAGMAGRIRQWARTHLDPDPHGGGQHGDEYRTTTVYFDTDAFDVFHRRGSFGRSKYRIRRYRDDETVFLERKMRQPAVLAKRRTILSLAGLPQLTESVVAADWPGYWFHRRITARQLRPVCQVVYSRMARGIIRDGEQVRLTLDADLGAIPARFARFPREVDALPTPALPDRLILELKYRGTPPALFRRLVEELALAPRAASKYRLGVVASGQAVPKLLLSGADTESGAGTEAFHA